MQLAKELFPSWNVGRIEQAVEGDQALAQAIVEYTGRGAILLKAWLDASGFYHFVLALDKDRAMDILKREPSAEEWLMAEAGALSVVDPVDMPFARTQSAPRTLAEGRSVGAIEITAIHDGVLDAWNERHDLGLTSRTDLRAAFEDAMSHVIVVTPEWRDEPVGFAKQDMTTGRKYGALCDDADVPEKTPLFAIPQVLVPTQQMVEIACRAFYGERWMRMDKGSAQRWMHDALEAVFFATTRYDTFQSQAGAWMGTAILPSRNSAIITRGDRLAEEVFELLQSQHYPRERLRMLEDYVFNRPIGEPGQEMGGVMLTLACYGEVAGLNMHLEGYRELARVNRPDVIARIKKKQESAAALDFTSPLPGVA